ncbi:MAG: transcriptional activator NhaR [Planctomycetota bacterium]
MSDWLNYHHLLYFWTVAKEGSVSRAAETLHLSQPTLSTQVGKLEKAIGAKLFERKGRGLVLTEIGQVAFRYADEIFGLGQELIEAVRGRATNDGVRLVVGVVDVLPKLIVYRLLRPALDLEDDVTLVVREGKLEELLGELSLHRIDLVLADSPLPPQPNVFAFNHHLGECGVSVFGTQELYDRYRDDFPKSLNEAPMLLPTHNTTLRRALEQWFNENDIRPFVRHEFEDSAILKVFGQAGDGLVVVPTAISDEVERQYSLRAIGELPGILEKFYAISVERRLENPAVVAISNAARKQLFVSGLDEGPN